MEDNSKKNNQEISDLTKGFDLIFKSLFEAAKKATFRIGFGSLLLGFAYIHFQEYHINVKLLVGMGIFFISAKIGGIIDVLIDNKLTKYLNGTFKNDSKNVMTLDGESPISSEDNLDLHESIKKKKEMAIIGDSDWRQKGNKE